MGTKRRLNFPIEGEIWKNSSNLDSEPFHWVDHPDPDICWSVPLSARFIIGFFNFSARKSGDGWLFLELPVAVHLNRKKTPDTECDSVPVRWIKSLGQPVLSIYHFISHNFTGGKINKKDRIVMERHFWLDLPVNLFKKNLQKAVLLEHFLKITGSCKRHHFMKVSSAFDTDRRPSNEINQLKWLSSN